tara:strand:- start:39 stop:884 length:846 start_codon:yes stop_codon:yes gene_type:complete
MIKLTECPRDAMQGIIEFIPTQLKVKYINSLLKVGFDVLDFGSFISPKAIPQLKDTADVLKGLELNAQSPKLLAIVANERGAKEAIDFDEVSILGFPFSVSEVFQLKNTHSTREESMDRVKNIQDICLASNKKLRVYLSMGFGNPYGEDYSPEIVLEWSSKLKEIGISELALSDTIGISNPRSIKSLFELLFRELNGIELSAHFHSAPQNWAEKVNEALKAGCMSYDSAINGLGGCPLAEDKLVGNLATEKLVGLFGNKLNSKFNLEAFSESLIIANEVFA